MSRGSFDTPPPPSTPARARGPPVRSRPRSRDPRRPPPRPPRPRDVQPGHEIGRGSGARDGEEGERERERGGSIAEGVGAKLRGRGAGGTAAAAAPAPAAHAAAEDPSRGAHVTLPVSSAKKLRFYDNADLAEIVAGHLEEKQALAEERALLLLELEAALARVPGVDDAAAEAKRRVAENPDHERVRRAAEEARRREDGVNRVMLASANAEIARMRSALEGAQTLADVAAREASLEAAAEASSEPPTLGDTTPTPPNDSDADPPAPSSPEAASEERLASSKLVSATARIAELERQLESAKTIAATEAEDAAEMEDRLADARSPDSDALAEASARIATLEADAAGGGGGGEASERIARLEADARAAKEGRRRVRRR